MSLRSWLRWERRRAVEDEAPVLDALLAHAARAIRRCLFSRPLEFPWPPRDADGAAVPEEVR